MFLNRRLWTLVHDQHECINRMRVEMNRRELEHGRSTRDLIEQFLIIQMRGEDVTAGLEQALIDLRDQVARMEEHV